MTFSKRFDKYLNKFKSSEPKIAKKTLGEDISEQLQHAVKVRLDAMLPLYASSGSTMTHVNAASFWELPEKQIVVTVLVVFHKNVVWKNGG